MNRRDALIAAGAASTAWFMTIPAANARATRTLKTTPKTVAWGYYDAKAAPVLDIEPELGRLYPAKRVIL